MPLTAGELINALEDARHEENPDSVIDCANSSFTAEVPDSRACWQLRTRLERAAVEFELLENPTVARALAALESRHSKYGGVRR